MIFAGSMAAILASMMVALRLQGTLLVPWCLYLVARCRGAGESRDFTANPLGYSEFLGLVRPTASATRVFPAHRPGNCLEEELG